MNLMDIIRRSPPLPWGDGDNIPWNEPGFSQRMLKEHLSQTHDAASRRTGTIERHVNFIYEQIMGNHPGRVLDLGCGPGLYATRLAKLGCEVVGIDFSPASINYARQICEAEHRSCSFYLEDIRTADYGADGSFDLAMFIFGEFNVFKPEDAKLILGKCAAALKPGGQILLEPSKAQAIRKMGQQGSSWYSQETGLFSPRPHLTLEESSWDEDHQVATNRYWIVDAETGEVNRYAASYQAYREDALRKMLGDAGFDQVTFYPNLIGDQDETPEFMAVVGRKQ